jgi:hypothetical protein
LVVGDLLGAELGGDLRQRVGLDVGEDQARAVRAVVRPGPQQEETRRATPSRPFDAA